MRVTKAYCDGCGKEAEELREIERCTPHVSVYNMIYGEFCSECIIKIDQFFSDFKEHKGKIKYGL
jgi:hypothetical protein